MCPPHNATLKNNFISAIANQTKDSDGFAKYLFSALVKTYVWAIGEVGMEDLNSKKDQIYDVIAKFIFLSFLFLFVVVMMNLVNAFAIQDIQVCILESRIFKRYSV